MRAAVLAATLAELAERGYAALTVENVARRAGVHKTTIYRRWENRERLVVDALTNQMAEDVPIPDTGTVEADLREHARAVVRWLTSPIGRAFMAVTLSDAARVPDVSDVKHCVFDDRFRRAEPVVARAIARGELPANIDPAELVKTVIAPIYLRVLVTAEPIDDATADRAAQAALVVARAGLLSEHAAHDED